MSVNLLPYFVHWPVLIFTVTTNPVNHTATDSLKIVCQGAENSVTVDSVQIRPHPATAVISKNVKGEITQNGRQNRVEIHSKNTVGSKKNKINYKNRPRVL